MCLRNQRGSLGHETVEHPETFCVSSGPYNVPKNVSSIQSTLGLPNYKHWVSGHVYGNKAGPPRSPPSCARGSLQKIRYMSYQHKLLWRTEAKLQLSCLKRCIFRKTTKSMQREKKTTNSFLKIAQKIDPNFWTRYCVSAIYAYRVKTPLNSELISVSMIAA